MHGRGEGEGGGAESPWLARFAKLVVACTFILLIAGGLVTSTDSGLSVPDWPLSYGQWFPPMVGGIRYEHTHRLIAASVGFLMLILAVWICVKDRRRWVRRLALAALGTVVAQAVLGGLTVIYFLPDALSVLHATLGQTFFCMAVALALFTSREWTGGALYKLTPTETLPPRGGGIGWGGGPGTVNLEHLSHRHAVLATLSIVLMALFYGQLILGAWIRHTGNEVGWHVGMALILLTVVGLAALASQGHPAGKRVSRPAFLLGGLTVLQIFIGMGAFIFTRMLSPSVHARTGEILFTTTHQSLGALLLATSVLLALRAWRKSPLLCKEGIGEVEFLPHPCLPAGRLPSPSKGRQSLDSYLELTKPRLTLLALVATAVGFYLASHGVTDWFLLGWTLVGAALVGGGANALNQYLERDLDALMTRTQKRPLPSGRIKPYCALRFGVFISILGILCLAVSTNLLTAFLASLTLASYLFIYTPLKRKSALCTLAGAIPGALPTLIGWAAAGGELTREAWILFSILFLWQLPHFLAIAWVYREDFRRAHLSMVTVRDEQGTETARLAILYSLALLPVSLMPTVVGMTGALYFFGALVLGTVLLGSGLNFAFVKKEGKGFFRSSIVYLSSLFFLMFLDKAGV